MANGAAAAAVNLHLYIHMQPQCGYHTLVSAAMCPSVPVPFLPQAATVGNSGEEMHGSFVHCIAQMSNETNSSPQPHDSLKG